MADDARAVQERRRELLRRRIAESGLTAGQSVDKPSVCAGERYPLSTGQRRMWFLQTMDPTDTTLNICVAYRLTGDLDEARLRAAFDDVVARHAVLRTTYGVDTEGEPYQVFHDDVEISWQLSDLTDLPESERKRRVEAQARDKFGTPFNLTNDLPLRTTLIRTGAAEFVLLLVVHHICWDDDSWSVLCTDLSAAYNGQQPTGQAPQFVAVEVLDCAAEPSVADVGYWADTLRPSPEPLELPGVASISPSRQADRRTRPLPADLFSRVEDFARRHAASPFMVLLAAYAVLVRRYTGAPDFLISVPVTARRAAAEAAIGYFGNTLLLRMTPQASDTFTSFLAAVRETCLNGFAHQAVGIDRVVREVNPERMGHDGMDRLVRLGFSMRKSASGFVLDGVTVRQLELGAVTAHLPLALAVVLEPEGPEASEEPEGPVVEFEYQTDVLEAALVDQMLTHYIQLLDHALAEPEHRLAGLDMLGAGERAGVLAQSHGELVAAPPTTMVAVLEAASVAAPDSLALVSDEAELTYTQLHRRANRLARWLIGQEIGTENIVGLRMTTSIEFIVAMLAVLKAGAAYLPIDPAYPDDRIEYLVTDARPQKVIRQHEFEAAERDAERLSDAVVTDADRLRPLRPDNLAYVIYTSGSTGQPKGVAVSHRAIAEHVEGFIAEWSMTAEDRLLQSSSVSFDASLLDIFVTLSLGARLIVPKPEAFGDVPYVADLIDRHRVTVLHMVPSMLSTLLLLPQVKEWRQLRHVPVGGEALRGEVADKFASHFDAQLRNHYGPTEAVVCSTHMQVEGSHGARVVPIGVPNRNVYAYVLDEELQPVPAEVIGELYLGGAQLARGYLGRPDLTAQRFVADPFNPGMRLYRSGDLVRRNISGELEFVGRADEQVKVRGFRIELGEVESVIATHPAVKHCLVVTEDTEAGPVLAAFLVPVAAAAHLDLDEIRAHTAAVLPEYMVPSAFAVIPEIPLTVSGKLDRRGLPAPIPVAVRSYREPTTATERRMCAIFARLFGWERIGAEDSFFGLGGHSLLAARLIAQIRAEFGVELTVRAVFDTPTPAGLAARLVDHFRAEFDIDLNRPELVAAVRPERPPLSYSQFAMWFQHRMRGPNDVFNMALALRINGPLDIPVLAAALNDVVARHEAMRTNFVEHEGVPYQLVHPIRQLELEVTQIAADQLDETVAELRRYVFALESESLIRPTLLAVGANTHVLLVLVHHIVTDHVSLGILFEDLIVAYRARLQGKAPQWAAPPFQFVDYALWQQGAFDAASAWGQAELAHWRDVLAGMPYEISVVPDHTRPPVLGRRGEVVDFTVSAARRAALIRLAEQNGATEFMVYQAAFAVLLRKLGGGTDIAIGSPVAARVDVATTNMSGPCANVVVLRTDLSGDPSLRTTLALSRDAVLDALAHQELPIERVVEALNPPRSPSRNHPLFQNSIHFRGAQDWALLPPDLTENGETTVVALPMDFEISILDLNLVLNVTPDAGLDVRVVANADLYEPETAALIADALDAVLEAFVTTPDHPLSALELLPAAALEKLVTPATPTTVARSGPVTGGSEETERALIGLLEELLEISDVDREDNFFALGGDSIISVQWAARASAQGLALTPAMVFEHMTIAELAAAVDEAADQPAGEPDSGPAQQGTPMSASGLDADALAALTASWHNQS
ncbi:non-ribosomal peptide synthetase [Mycobacterium riyadhense]|uniref:non-ribosomal peptide synthetase n=1 Tax=Mycobacterium riyadhense TaxID=486698 RepID=UPI001957903D|nr:non-ribosomal peptide synthetase [Mycobacterium riyadhense]